MSDPGTTGPPLHVPAPSEVPRKSAVDTHNLGVELLTDVMAWYTAAVEHADLGNVLDARRRLAVVVELIERRDLSAAGARDAAQALRLVERVAGRRMIATGVERRDLWRDHPHEVVDRCWSYGQADGHAFTAALATARASGSLDADVVDAALAGVAPPPPAPDAESPPPPPAWTAAQSRTALGGVLTGLGDVVGDVAIGDMDPYTLDPEEAADAARELFGLLVPLMGLHTHLTAHGQGRRIRSHR